MWDRELLREIYSLRVGDRGRIVLPAPVRERLGVEEGDRLALSVSEDGTIHLSSGRGAARRGRGLLRKGILPGGQLEGRSLADELVAERRAEASRE